MTETDTRARAERINAEGVGRLPAFSHAVRAGELLFLSGMLGTREDSFDLVEGGVADQTRQALQNLGKILETAGASFADLVNLKVFLVDMTRFAEMNEAYCAFFPTDPPSRSSPCAAPTLTPRDHSTVTLLARFRGWSTSVPFSVAT